MRHLTLLVMAASVVFVTPARADKPVKAEPAKAAKVATGTKAAKMTCEDFIALDEVSKPKVVYWGEGFNRKGKAQDAVLDVERTDSLVPVLIEECKKAPTESFVKAGAALTPKPTKADKTPAPIAKTTAAAKPTKMTCEAFIALDEVSRPKVVYWAEGFNSNGKPDDAVFDVESTEHLVPVLVEECKAAPKESFWKKVKAEFKKVF